MSMWLCRTETVTNPFYISELDIHVYSSPELSYVIVKNPLLVLEEFVDDRLLLFIREQLNMGLLALKMERLKKTGESDLEILCLFLQEADYCLPLEISQFRQNAARLKKKSPAEYQKERSDYLYQIGQYKKALTGYGKILDMPRSNSISEPFLGKVHGNMGACYAHLFQYEHAAKAYEKSYSLSKDATALKCLFFLQQIEPEIPISEHCRQLLASEVNADWQKEFSTMKQQIMESEEYKRLCELFLKDPIRRHNGAREQIDIWKRRYRSMQSPS